MCGTGQTDNAVSALHSLPLPTSCASQSIITELLANPGFLPSILHPAWSGDSKYRNISKEAVSTRGHQQIRNAVGALTQCQICYCQPWIKPVRTALIRHGKVYKHLTSPNESLDFLGRWSKRDSPIAKPDQPSGLQPCSALVEIRSS